MKMEITINNSDKSFEYGAGYQHVIEANGFDLDTEDKIIIRGFGAYGYINEFSGAELIAELDRIINEEYDANAKDVSSHEEIKTAINEIKKIYESEAA